MTLTCDNSKEGDLTSQGESGTGSYVRGARCCSFLFLLASQSVVADHHDWPAFLSLTFANFQSVLLFSMLKEIRTLLSHNQYLTIMVVGI